MKVNNTLVSLDISSWGISDAGAATLAEALAVNSKLTSMSLYGNPCDDAGARALGEALKVNNTLTALDLSETEFGTAGTQALAEALTINTTLITFGPQLDHYRLLKPAWARNRRLKQKRLEMLTFIMGLRM